MLPVRVKVKVKVKVKIKVRFMFRVRVKVRVRVLRGDAVRVRGTGCDEFLVDGTGLDGPHEGEEEYPARQTLGAEGFHGSSVAHTLDLVVGCGWCVRVCVCACWCVRVGHELYSNNLLPHLG